MRPPISFELRGEYIALDSLLKATGLAASGGLAKAMITEGAVRVDGQPEQRRTRKVRAGQTVQAGGVRVHVAAAPVTDGRRDSPPDAGAMQLLEPLG